MTLERPRDHQPSRRLEAFSDAVFAFAATLLVVTLEVPRNYAELSASLHEFLAFGAGFAVLVAIWAIHRSLFRRFHLTDGLTVFLNSVLLLMVLVSVYPLKFVTRGFLIGIFMIEGLQTEPIVTTVAELAGLFVLYGLGVVCVFACFAGMYARAHALRERMGLTPVEAFRARFNARHYSLFAILGLASVLLARFQIGMSILLPAWIYMLLGPLCAWHGVVGERGRPRDEG